MSKNSSFHSKAKHIDVRYHWIRNVLEEKQLQLQKVHIDDNGADMLTKPLSKEKQEGGRRMVGMEIPSIFFFGLKGEVVGHVSHKVAREPLKAHVPEP